AINPSGEMSVVIYTIGGAFTISFPSDSVISLTSGISLLSCTLFTCWELTFSESKVGSLSQAEREQLNVIANNNAMILFTNITSLIVVLQVLAFLQRSIQALKDNSSIFFISSALTAPLFLPGSRLFSWIFRWK